MFIPKGIPRGLRGWYKNSASGIDDITYVIVLISGDCYNNHKFYTLHFKEFLSLKINVFLNV